MTDRIPELRRRLAQINAALVEEATALPGETLAYPPPHEHPRATFVPRWDRTGRRLPGYIRIPPDCPKPVRGRCQCQPDGSWRPVGGVIRADSLAQAAELVELDGGPAVWTTSTYVQDPDGRWRCRLPMRRALERLQGESVTKWAILARLRRGVPLHAAWGASGEPADPIGYALAICRQVQRWADQEAATLWERRPRRWKSVGWVDKSESQQRAEESIA